MQATSADTALALWAAQVEALASTPGAAYDAILAIHNSFGELHMRYSEGGDLDTAQLIRTAYDHAMEIYTQNQQYQQALGQGGEALRLTVSQRDEAMSELSEILRALKTGDDTHPQLAGFASDVAVKTRDLLLEDEDFLEQAEIDSFSTMERQVRSTLHRYGLSQWQSQRLLEYLCGMFQMDAEQLNAFSAFLDTLS